MMRSTRCGHCRRNRATAVSAGQRRRLSALAVRPVAAGDRAARQGGRRPGDRVRRERSVGPSHQRRRRDRTDRQSPRRFRRGIAALAQDLGDRMADTIILTMSEFGRAVAENGNRGTDHGHGNAMMLIGGERQGRRGLRPLAGAESRATLTKAATSKVTTDFRDVFGEVVDASPRRRANRPPRAVFPGYGVKPAAFRNVMSDGTGTDHAKTRTDDARATGSSMIS